MRNPSAWAVKSKFAAVLAAGLFAIATWALSLDLRWLTVMAGICGSIALTVGVVWEWNAASLEAALQSQEGERQLLLQGPIRDADILRLGVDPAVGQDLLDGGEVPNYQARVEDQTVVDAVIAAATSGGPRLVLVTGGSKVGKSRTLFESLRKAQGAVSDFWIVAPRDTDSLRNLLSAACKTVQAPEGKTVALWLDDIEVFVNGGLTPVDLDDWFARFGGIAVGTAGGKGPALSVERSLLERPANLIGVTRTSEQIHIEPLRVLSGLHESASGAVKEYGLAAYLVAGPALKLALSTARHNSQAPVPSGVAVVAAASDWVRCGRTDPVPGVTLLAAARHYFAANREFDEDAALSWACAPIDGGISLLREASGGYLPYDYAITLCRDIGLVSERPSGAMWSLARQTALSPVRLMAVGRAARGLGEHETAMACWGDLVQRFAGDPSADVRRIVALALIEQARSELDHGDCESALATLHSVVARYGDDKSVEVRDAVAFAFYVAGTTHLGIGQGDPASATREWQQIVDRYVDDDVLRHSWVRPILLEQAAVYMAMGQAADAEAGFQRLLDICGDDPRETSRYLSMVQLFKGSAQSQGGNHDGAIETWQAVIDVYGHDLSEGTRKNVAKAMLWRGRELAVVGRGVEARATLDRIAALFGGDEHLADVVEEASQLLMEFSAGS